MAAPSCREVVARLIEYLDESLDPLERAELEAHLRACDKCVVYLRSYRQAVCLSRAAFDDVAEVDAAPLAQSILAARRRTT
jgi:anti-sigma factor RsiW